MLEPSDRRATDAAHQRAGVISGQQAVLHTGGVIYANSTTGEAGKAVTYGWHFSYDPSLGWITSGFTHSPTAAFMHAGSRFGFGRWWEAHTPSLIH
jgi:hypothetical protein